jgi:hypothetical protein
MLLLLLLLLLLQGVVWRGVSQVAFPVMLAACALGEDPVQVLL